MPKQPRDYVEKTKVLMFRKRPVDARMASVQISEATSDGRRAKRTQKRLPATSTSTSTTSTAHFDLPWRSDPVELDYSSDIETEDVPASEVPTRKLSATNGKTFATLVSATVLPYGVRH